MHYLGFYGLPRRVCCYHPDFMWLNVIRSWGGFLSIVRGFLVFFIAWESIIVGNKVISHWGKNTVILRVLTLPLPHHSIYVSSSSSWGVVSHSSD